MAQPHGGEWCGYRGSPGLIPGTALRCPECGRTVHARKRGVVLAHKRLARPADLSRLAHGAQRPDDWWLRR